MECMLISSIKTINEPCFRTVVVEGVRLEMEIDCGAAVSVISSETYEGEFADISMQKCTKKLAVISGSRLVVEGQIPVQVELNGRRKTVKLIVLRSGSSFTPLLGRDWLDIFYSDWRNAFGSGASVNQLSFPASEEQIVDDVKGFRWRESLLCSPKSAEAGGYPKAPRFVLGEEREQSTEEAC
ncbi:uncharacterized protein LOC135699468 isoform X2 [Ochlerotatus camptorhynchus]|uniref:uncharacterized protein LOC135699468 isoform X2 n=1 Tax=Ochlerotatus camptorhynchus TaxID=644619 RepID=UPI0031E48DA3